MTIIIDILTAMYIVGMLFCWRFVTKWAILEDRKIHRAETEKAYSRWPKDLDTFEEYVTRYPIEGDGWLSCIGTGFFTMWIWPIVLIVNVYNKYNGERVLERIFVGKESQLPQSKEQLQSRIKALEKELGITDGQN